MWIILILVAVPIIEIALFIELGGWVGLWPTIALVIVTAIRGIESFVRPPHDAFEHGAIGLTDARVQFCFPEANREDQIRRAYVRWVHGSFSKRGSMPVGEALLAALDEVFGCE